MSAGSLTALEICAGAGGQALGLEQAGFDHAAVIEIEPAACATLRLNRPSWNVIEGDVALVDGRDYRGIDLIAGGVPCPPFSIAGQRLGADDERDLFPEALRLVEEAEPRAVLLENVRGLATSRFASYRAGVLSRLHDFGYATQWQVINASEHGVPQLRPRFVLLAVREEYADGLAWPQPQGTPPTVGEALVDLMAAGGWEGALAWRQRARGVGPTLVGGSRKHGGPDLGPSRARAEWASLGVNGKVLANESPQAGDPLDLLPALTLRMTARLQGFPDDWQFFGRKTAAYRQVGNAFPPPVARALGLALAAALGAAAGATGNADDAGSGRKVRETAPRRLAAV
jgi:DNA (cytosine-5)-methyltransferase 1